MSEENVNNTEFDPRDLNKDGIVTTKEKILYAAYKAEEKMSKAFDDIKADLGEVVEKAKEIDYKEKFEKAKEKGSEIASVVAEKTKVAYGEAKELAGKAADKISEKMKKEDASPVAEAPAAPEAPAEPEPPVLVPDEITKPEE